MTSFCVNAFNSHNNLEGDIIQSLILQRRKLRHRKIKQKVVQLELAELGAKVSRIQTLGYAEAGIPEMWQLPESDVKSRLFIFLLFFKATGDWGMFVERKERKVTGSMARVTMNQEGPERLG